MLPASLLERGGGKSILFSNCLERMPLKKSKRAEVDENRSAMWIECRDIVILQISAQEKCLLQKVS